MEWGLDLPKYRGMWVEWDRKEKLLSRDRLGKNHYLL